MKKRLLIACLFTTSLSLLQAQNNRPASCTVKDVLSNMMEQNPNAQEELNVTEEFIKSFIEKNKAIPSATKRNESTYTIPVVLHVFHYGDNGKIDLEQAQSGIDVINEDFNGLNEGWETIDPMFDPIKKTLDINFCLASIDPNGNPTTGVIYHENEAAVYNETDLLTYAWDNYKYMNVYLPKYVFDSTSNFTAFAYFPSVSGSNSNAEGVVYSSIRWGFGTKSQLSPGEDWASVGTHEVGHWLGLYHTFQDGCNGGDNVEDTPPTLGGVINFDGCYTSDFSCGVATNGSNFMDYNHACKKMFTEGQVERMAAALEHPTRSILWSESNLEATGCLTPTTNTTEVFEKQKVRAFPNPARDQITFEFKNQPNHFMIYNSQGQQIYSKVEVENILVLNTNNLPSGIYFYTTQIGNKQSTGKFILE